MKNTIIAVVAAMLFSVIWLDGASGLSPNSGRAGRHSASPSVLAPLRALAYLASSQASDGHWADGQTAIQATALSLSAFLRMGETVKSHRYGKHVSNAYDWLQKAEPATPQDRIAMIVALSDFYTLHRTPAAAQMVQNLLGAVDTADAGAWGDLLSYTRLPAESSRPPFVSMLKDTDAKYKGRDLSAVPQSVNGYLQMFLVNHADYRTGGKASTAHERTYTRVPVASQREDGAFPTEDEAHRPAATALVILSFSHLHAGAYQFSPVQEPAAEQQDPDTEIKVDIE